MKYKDDKIIMYANAEGFKVYFKEIPTFLYNRWYKCMTSNNYDLADSLLIRAVKNNETWALMYLLSTENPKYSNKVEIVIGEH